VTTNIVAGMSSIFRSFRYLEADFISSAAMLLSTMPMISPEKLVSNASAYISKVMMS
jgi:hypothetical protein